jgi:hypothetical protein
MRRVNFDYGNTCPKIDKAIGEAKGTIENFLSDLIGDVCPYLPSGTLQDLAADKAAELYSELERAFEVVRSANEDMRSEADRQISELKDEIDSLEAQVQRLEDQ